MPITTRARAKRNEDGGQGTKPKPVPSPKKPVTRTLRNKVKTRKVEEEEVETHQQPKKNNKVSTADSGVGGFSIGSRAGGSVEKQVNKPSTSTAPVIENKVKTTKKTGRTNAKPTKPVDIIEEETQVAPPKKTKKVKKVRIKNENFVKFANLFKPESNWSKTVNGKVESWNQDLAAANDKIEEIFHSACENWVNGEVVDIGKTPTGRLVLKGDVGGHEETPVKRRRQPGRTAKRVLGGKSIVLPPPSEVEDEGNAEATTPPQNKAGPSKKPDKKKRTKRKLSPEKENNNHAGLELKIPDTFKFGTPPPLPPSKKLLFGNVNPPPNIPGRVSDKEEVEESAQPEPEPPACAAINETFAIPQRLSNKKVVADLPVIAPGQEEEEATAGAINETYQVVGRGMTNLSESSEQTFHDAASTMGDPIQFGSQVSLFELSTSGDFGIGAAANEVNTESPSSSRETTLQPAPTTKLNTTYKMEMSEDEDSDLFETSNYESFHTIPIKAKHPPTIQCAQVFQEPEQVSDVFEESIALVNLDDSVDLPPASIPQPPLAQKPKVDTNTAKPPAKKVVQETKTTKGKPTLPEKNNYGKYTKEFCQKVLKEPIRNINESLYAASILEEEEEDEVNILNESVRSEYFTGEPTSAADTTLQNHNYDITHFEDLDEQNGHRAHKSIPIWARGGEFLLGQLYLSNPNLTNEMEFNLHNTGKELDAFPPCNNRHYKLFPAAPIPKSHY